jgi:hypothetical protein
MMSRRRLFDHPSDMEPLMPEDHAGKLAGLAPELIRKTERLRGCVHPLPRTTVAELVRSMKSCFLNLMEGHRSTPRDIEAALRRDFSSDQTHRPVKHLTRSKVRPFHSVVLSPLLVGVLSVSTASPLAEDFFPVMAWNWAPNDPAVLRKMRECGLTVAGFVSPAALDACQAAGLRAIVSDPRTADYDWKNVDEAAARPRVEGLLAETARHPAVFGYYLRDEPGAEMFAGLAKVAAIVRERAPDKWAYVNLFPNYANAQQLGTATYTNHLETFIATVKPTILSYDHYALMEDGTLRDGYWLNLEQMRAAAKRHGLPFWNIVLTVAHFSYREPTAADLRFQVYSTLAYGGRGLSYFTYFTPSVGNYRMAPIDQFGNATPTWYHLQHVNKQIEKLGPTLLKLTSDHVYHFGSQADGAHGPSEQSLVKDTGGGDFAVGDFTHADGARYLMIVNKDLSRSRHCRVTFRASPKRLQFVSPYSGNLEDFSGEHTWLAPGQGVLLRVEP